MGEVFSPDLCPEDSSPVDLEYGTEIKFVLSVSPDKSHMKSTDLLQWHQDKVIYLGFLKSAICTVGFQVSKTCF